MESNALIIVFQKGYTLMIISKIWMCFLGLLSLVIFSNKVNGQNLKEKPIAIVKKDSAYAAYRTLETLIDVDVSRQPKVNY